MSCHIMACVRTTAAALVVLVALARVAHAQTAENVAVVINDASQESQRVGDYYVKARGIPAENVIRITASSGDALERTEYVATIERPIAAALAKGTLQDRILYIVLTKGIPLRISGTEGLEGTVSSVDSELTLLYRRMTGRPVVIQGRIPNPYYLGTAAPGEAKRFSHRTQDIYLVSRLDAFTESDAIALIDRAQQATPNGRIVLDERAAVLSDSVGDKWLADTAKRLTDAGQGERVMLESTTTGARDVDQVLGYYSWGSNDTANRVRHYNMKFVPGSIAGAFVSTDARTLQAPPDDWTPSGKWDDRRAWFAGSPQSLIGDLIRDGVTGVSGYVAEPYLQSTVRPEILFPAYTSGFNLVESFYLALPHLSWQSVIIGDPLCAPFQRPTLARDEIDGGIDPKTELPAFFSKRRIESVQAEAKGVSADAAGLAILGDTKLARGDRDGARAAYEQAATAKPDWSQVQLGLGMLYEQLGDHAQALERYRTVVKLQPDNLIGLNNLAYNLAVYQKATSEAVPIAQRAASLAPNEPSVLDTLAWIHHLAGNNQEAERIYGQVVRIGTSNADIRLNAAVVFAEVGAIKEAQEQLAQALRLNASLAKREEVIKLQERLKTAPKS